MFSFLPLFDENDNKVAFVTIVNSVVAATGEHADNTHFI
jgi:hypothetical protein